MSKAIAIFPSESVPKDIEKRRAILEDPSEKTERDIEIKWDELDVVFFKYEDDLLILALNYLSKNLID